MGQLISQPLTDKVIEHKEFPQFSYSLGSMQGYRQSQEDAHSIHWIDQLTFYDIHGAREVDIKIYAVFDGHGGAESSLFLSHELIPILIEQLQAMDKTNHKTTQGLIIHKIKKAFLKADYELYNHLKHHRSQSGSTAIVGIIVDNTELYSINTGDSRLIISHDGHSKDLSYDHKPTHIGELIRINDAGGSVSYNRVGGVLALSRAFGDFGFKHRELKTHELLHSEETQVTVEPEIIIHKIQLNDEFIVLACDGIWDVFNSRDLISFIRHCLCLGDELNAIVTKVLEYTISMANQVTGVGFDNMSIIIVACQQQGESLEQWYARMKLVVEVEKFGS
jgi:protein phosphatase PTC4